MVATNIQNEISAKYSSNHDKSLIPQKTEQSTPEQDESSHVKHPQDQYENLKNEMKWLKRIALGILVLLVIVLVFVFKTLKGIKSIIKIVLNSDRINRKFTSKTTTQQTANNVRTFHTLTEREKNIIVDKDQECLRLNEKEVTQSAKQVETNSPVSTFSTTFKYLKGKTGKTFSRVENTPEDSFFRIKNEYGDTADFEFFGNEEEAIAKRIFHDDICQILSGNYQNAHSIEMITPGKAKRIGEQWTVVEPIKIRLT